jgi:hypothetical protein
LNAGEAREELDAQVYPSLRRKKSILKIVRSENPDSVPFTLSGHNGGNIRTG